MTVKGVVLDMDGLMFDTENLTYKLQRDILGEMDIDFSLDEYKLSIGKRTADIDSLYRNKVGEGFDMTSFRAKCREAFVSYTDRFGVPVKKGLFELLDFLREKQMKTALCTSTTHKSAERILRIAGVYDHFDAFVCAEDVSNGKPHPEPFLEAARKLDLEPRECVALEDSLNGITSAYRAGMIPIMIPDLIEPDDEVRAMCRVVLGDLSEVKEYI